MSTIRNIISDVRGFSKLLSSDALINDRVIYRDIKSASLMLVKQQTDKRKLYSSPTLFTLIPCLDMIQVPIGECCEFTSDRKIARSVEKMPKIAENIYGLMVQYCTSVDNLKFFSQSSPRRYSNLLKLNITNSSIYFWVFNDYLYVTNEDTKLVNLSAYFEDDVPNKLLCPQNCDCKAKPDCDPCTNPLDLEFKCPGFLENSIKDMVAKRLLTTYFNLAADRTSNNLDETSK